MSLLRTALVSTLLGMSTASFAAMPQPNPDPAAREARMQEALDHYYAKQAQMAQETPKAKPTRQAKHHRHAKKSSKAMPQDDNTKAKDQTQ
jgi:hypothetical protein